MLSLNVAFRSGVLIVTVVLNEKYEYEYDIEDYMLEFCQYIAWNARMMGGSVKFTNISLDEKSNLNMLNSHGLCNAGHGTSLSII